MSSSCHLPKASEPPEDHYPCPPKGIAYVKSDDTWEVNLSSGITHVCPHDVSITIVVRNAKTPEQMIKKLCATLSKLGWSYVTQFIQYRRMFHAEPIVTKTSHIYTFDELYNQSVTPNFQKLNEVWENNTFAFSKDEMFDYSVIYECKEFSHLSKHMQYSFYCWVIEHKLIKAK